MMLMRKSIFLPEIGSDIREVKVTSIETEPGAVLRPNELYMTVATDKVDIELELQHPAVVIDVPVSLGDVVAAGGLLLEVEVDDDAELLERWDAISNVEIGLRYLASRKAETVCSRPELESYKFSEFEIFVQRTARIATKCRELDPLDIPSELVDDVRTVLFQLTRLISEMDGFNPERFGLNVLDRHLYVKWRVGVQSEEVLRRFERLCERASGEARRRDRDRSERAYLFVSYSQEDHLFVSEFLDRVAGHGIRYFRDERDVELGQRIQARVEEELASASHVVVVVTAASLQSQWVAYEIGFARGREITVVPYVIHSGLRLPDFISGYRYLRQKEEDAFVRSLARFRRGI